MNQKRRIVRTVSLLLLAGMLTGVPAVQCEAAVITSNATDKIAVMFQENTAYSAGDYVIFDGEMYICTQDTQGPWSGVEADFLQITKNRELGTQEDLAASYDAAKDPSEEKSLMAFAANAWQKLKGFFGMEQKDENVDASQYKNSSVSAKLNFLQQQNQQLDQNVSNLQGWITQSFQSVSNGKSILAAAITDKKGTAGPKDSFHQLGQAIRDLAQIQYNDGHGAGHSEGYDQGYNAGITFADGRVNENSASYQQGAATFHPQIWAEEIRVEKTGPNKEHDCFTSGEGITSNHIEYSFRKQFHGHTIIAAYLQARYSSPFGTQMCTVLSALAGDSYISVSDTQDFSLYVNKDVISWGRVSFNLLDTGAYQTLKFKVVYI